MTEPNDEAFPKSVGVYEGPNRDGVHRIISEGGLTKREHFAGMCLVAIYGNQSVCEGIRDEWGKHGETEALSFLVAVAAVKQADELILALNRK